MTGFKAVCVEALGQSRSVLRIALSQTEEMFRLAVSKLTKRNAKLHSRTLLTKPDEALNSSKTTVTVPEYADVVIIGGGTAGCNALYSLAKNGVRAVLLERSKLSSGTTWHTAGLIWRLRPNDTEIELLDITRNILMNLEEEAGMNSIWINNGGIYIARSDMRIQEYKRLVTVGRSHDIEAHIISPREAQELFPLLDPNAFTGAMYTPGDGVVDPATLLDALTKSAKSNGAQIIEDCPVTKILTDKNMFETKRVTGVETPYGLIKTNCVLNASGVWSRSTAKMAGLDIPLIPMKHAYVITAPLEGVQGLPNIRDHDGSVYFRIQGSSLCVGGYEPNPIILQCVPKNFTFDLYELDWNVFSTHTTEIIKLVPKFSTAGIRTTVCGPESFTPDHKPIMGEDPRCLGFYHSCGYNSAGMMLGGGCGDQIAKWIIHGRPDKHMHNYDIRRFTPEQTRDAIWANERSHESYVKNYSIVFPHDEPLSGRNFKTDPFHHLLVKEGAVMEERQGWERPGWFLSGKVAPVAAYDYYGNYGSPKHQEYPYAEMLAREYTFDFPVHHKIIGEEALACRNNAALFDMSYFGKFYLCGPDAQKAADYLFTSNTDRDINRTVYSCMLNKNGGVEADCTVTAIETGSGGVADPIFRGKAFYIVSGGMSAYHTWCHMKNVIREQDFKVTLHDATEQIGILSIQGPNSRRILETIVDEELSNEKFPMLTSKLMNIKGNLVRTLRVSFVGELGFELHIPSQLCENVYAAVMAVGRNYKMKLAGYRALYSLSSEKGYHLWHYDLRTTDNPIEAGLGFLCRKNGDYQGRKAVKKLRENGVKRKLAHFHLKHQVPLWGLETVYRDGQIVGYLRRGEYAYALEKSIGQAYIKHPEGENVTKHFLENGVYEIEIMRKRYPATIHLQSPFDPENKRPLGEYSSS
ncbi:sarcosine dehydrogenase, mitochondrial [Cephus cinctus]|uniref:Sarcosine dehydrogenase, mitochondrial n=1 Tax=Cephus cinctus TaxID=211228 RepID=A0AAJ7CBW6_CEPCN|nr:sarcosine dehydrogenase, mitochondrial [Cephus cinctus]XP_024946430.1 sarcosine dehydrogenase, mitochondrial [Cephus cinctus]